MFLRQQARALAGGLGSSLRRAHGAHSDVTRGLLTSQASPADTERRTGAMTPSPAPAVVSTRRCPQWVSLADTSLSTVPSATRSAESSHAGHPWGSARHTAGA